MPKAVIECFVSSILIYGSPSLPSILYPLVAAFCCDSVGIIIIPLALFTILEALTVTSFRLISFVFCAFRTFNENGIVVSCGSDAPCTSPDPIVWIDKAVNNMNQSQAVSVQEALRMCTYNGYYVTFDEKERGSLEAGKIADMVVLSDDLYSVDKKDIKNIKVEGLILSGKKYESCRENVVKAVIRGMFSGNMA